jgi:hypothetical protein
VHDHIIQDEFDGDRIKALNCLKAELELYNHYLNGRTYGYISYDAEGNEEDSCWGFYGLDFETNGLYENAGINRMDVEDIVEVA